jgi:hypothetical protein
LDKAFRLFFPEKVPTIGVIGGENLGILGNFMLIFLIFALSKIN